VILRGIIGLLIIAIIGGSLLSWLIFSTPDIICLPIELKFLTLIVCIIGGIRGYLISNISLYFFNKSLSYYFLRNFSGLIWYMPIISTLGIIFFPLKLGGQIIKSFDQGWREYFGAQSLYSTLIIGSQYRQIFQNNNLKIYLLIFVLLFIILLGLLLL
jgi:NADH-ubiquinone oxidoreductase chain 5